jgi:hypothetical protein
MDNTAPIPGAYRIEHSLYLRDPFDAYRDENVRKVTTIGPNQGGRTKAMEVASLWAIARRNGPMMWNSHTNEKAQQFASARWWPMARGCEDVQPKLPNDPRLLFPCHFILRDGVDVHIQGANEGNLQEKSVMNQFNDELFQWPSGMLNEAWIRCDVSYAWNYKAWNGSVADQEDDEADWAYRDGDKRRWFVPCAKCAKLQYPIWDQLKWTKNATTMPNGEYNYQELAKTIRYECIECGHPHPDSAKTRRLWNEGGVYVPEVGEPIKINGGGRIVYPFNAVHASFKWNILCINWPGVRWAQWVEEFLKATLTLRRLGNVKPLHIFWSRRMAEPFDQAKHCASKTRLVVSDYSLGHPNFYIANKWMEEYIRFMACDKQEVGYPFVIRAAKKTGESRLIECGDSESYDEIESTSQKFSVAPRRVIIDAGYESRQVYSQCVRRGWTWMKGDPMQNREGFDHIIETKDAAGNVKRMVVSLPYSKIKWGDPMTNGRITQKPKLNPRIGIVNEAAIHEGRFARGYHFINLACKDLLNALKQGRTTTYWGVPQDVTNGYIAHMNSEVRYKIIGARGRIIFWWSNSGPDGKGKKRANHWWDCEVMITVAMVMQGILRIDEWKDEADTTITESVSDGMAAFALDNEPA